LNRVIPDRIGGARGRSPADSCRYTPALTSHDHRRNFRLGVINGALFRFGDVFIDTEMVLTWFLAQLGASNVLIGLISPIRFGGSFLLQMVASGYMERVPYKLPFYRLISIFRSLSLLLFAIVVALVPPGSPWLIITFFAVLSFFSMGAGLVGIPFMDMVGKVVPPRRRGAFFGQRMFWGGLLALAGSSVVGFLLAEPDGLRFPVNVAILFVFASILFGATAWSWILVKEPPSRTSNAVGRGVLREIGTQLCRGIQILKEDSLYQRYAIVRLALTAATWAAPFYVVYARNELGIPAGMLGLYLAVRSGAEIASNLLWARISDGLGNRRVIILTNALGLATPAIVLIIGLINRLQPGASHLLSYAFALIFLTAGVYSAGSGIGITNYVLDLAPEEKRPLYLAFTNTLFGLARFTGMVSGLIVDWVGFDVLMLFSVFFSAIALMASFSMGEPRSAR
jgi:MFS family permease